MNRTFSDFIQSATPAEKEAVYLKAMNKACEDQKAIVKQRGDTMNSLRLWILEKKWSYWAKRHTRRLIEARAAKENMKGLEPEILRLRKTLV